MCTIITIDHNFYKKNKKQFFDQVDNDSLFNCDGWSLVGLDPQNETNNIRFASMNLSPLVSVIKSFFDQSGKNARIWLHARAATTAAIGIGFVHGFDDQNGRIIMHNGVLRDSVLDYNVDSFSLAFDYSLSSAKNLNKDLAMRKETFANIFVIDTIFQKYSVVRRSVGSLYRDNNGNYSTNKFASIDIAVKHNSAIDHIMPIKIKSQYWAEQELKEEILYAKQNFN